MPRGIRKPNPNENRTELDAQLSRLARMERSDKTYQEMLALSDELRLTAAPAPRSRTKTMQLCIVPGCERQYQAQEFCGPHLSQAQHGKTIEEMEPMKATKCPECDRPVYARGVCRMHYDRLKRDAR